MQTYVSVLSRVLIISQQKRQNKVCTKLPFRWIEQRPLTPASTPAGMYCTSGGFIAPIYFSCAQAKVLSRTLD